MLFLSLQLRLQPNVRYELQESESLTFADVKCEYTKITKVMKSHTIWKFLCCIVFFLLRDIDLWTMTLIYELDLDIHPLYLHAKIQVCMSVHSSRRARQSLAAL